MSQKITLRVFTTPIQWFTIIACLLFSLRAIAVELPIVVAQGVSQTDKQTKEVSVNVPSSAGTINRLWLNIHNIAYDGQVEVKAGNSGWITLSNDEKGLSFGPRAKAYGGIGGGFRTMVIKVDLPNGAVKAGSETKVSFRLGALASPMSVKNGSPSRDISGYRVIGLGFFNTNGKRVLASGTNTFKSPNNYDNIPDTASAIENGAKLWRKKNKLKSYPGGPRIKASCASCHTQDGRDLKYFGFTNHSITQRGKFHGLSIAEANDVAAYVRSRPVNAPGRPWNPPYQPGPNVLKKDVSEWAAGAGLSAVTTSDKGSLKALFPDTNGNGKHDQKEIDAAFSAKNGLNASDRLETFSIPISVQLPDWNRWLPIIAPDDIWSDFFTAEDSPYLAYQNIREKLDTNGVDYYLAGESRKKALRDLLNSLGLATRAFIGKKPANSSDARYDPRNSTSGSQWRLNNGPRLIGHKKTIGGSAVNQREMAKRSISTWLGVKYFEIMTEYGLEDKNQQIFDGNSKIADGRARGERRGWPITQQSVHANAPHITSRNINNWEGQDGLVGDYLSSVWYHLQMVLNTGQRQKMDSVSPQDWEYQYNHIYELSERSGRDEPLRYVQSLMKGYQVRDTQRIQKGWEVRVTHPWRIVSMKRKQARILKVLDTLNNYESGLHTRIVNATIKAFLDVVRAPNFEGVALGDSWPRYDPVTTTLGSPSTNWWKLEEEYTPLSLYDGKGHYFPRNNALNFYRMFPILKDINADPVQVNALLDWCKKAWPGGYWEQFRLDVPVNDSFIQIGLLDIVQKGSGKWTTVNFETKFSERPVVILGALSRFGYDPSTTRVRNITKRSFQFQIDEWDYLGGGHINERLSWMAVEPGVHGVDGGVIEAIRVQNVDHNWQPQTFRSKSYAGKHVVLAQAMTDNGNQAITTRLRKVTNEGLELKVQEEEANDGIYNNPEEIGIVILGGNIEELRGGKVRRGNTGNEVTHNSAKVSFNKFTGEKTVFANMRTTNGRDPAVVRYTNLTDSGLELLIEDEMSADDEVGHNEEVVGWAVIGVN